MSICNFRCHYCYLSQRPASFQGIQPEMKYSPREVADALSIDRIGGYAYMNFCADGETLLVKNLEQYVKALVELGHYAEVVTNLTVTPVLDKFLSWDKELLQRLSFKCSFHYLELKRTGKLDLFAENVKKIWAAGASANIEITPSDELIPYLDEVKEFSMNHFGALPHLTIARDDRTSDIAYLTHLTDDEYTQIWSSFHSDFWAYKRTVFGIRQKNFCYAGHWALYIDLTTGIARQCYNGRFLGDVFENPSIPLPEKPIGRCPISHCYNAHSLLTLGCIPHTTDIRYGDIRDRESKAGNWLQPDLKAFFNTKLEESNTEVSTVEKSYWYTQSLLREIRNRARNHFKK